MRDHTTKQMDGLALDAAFADIAAEFEGGPRGQILWMQVHAQYRMAQVARDAMCNPAAAQIDRDLMVVAYSRHTDRLMELLALMSEQQLLVEIGTLLSRRAR